MLKLPVAAIVFVLLCSPLLTCQQFSTELHVPSDRAVHDYKLPAAILASPKKAWSIRMDVAPLDEISAEPFLVITDSKNKRRLEAHIVSDSAGQRIEILVRSDFSDQPLSIGLPLNLLDKTKAHPLLLRYRGYSLDLFCDGVLVDQEWPMGTIVGTDIASAAVRFPVRQLGIGNIAVSDEQISNGNGGSEEVAKRADMMFGVEPQQVQYSWPRGWNTNAGDAMPFFHDGVFHLFFLFDRRQHRSKWGLGAHQWVHIASTDLVHWKHYDQALTIEHEWEGSICTGSVFFHQGKYYAFYASRMPDRSERLGMAESQDGIHFRKIVPTPFAEPSAPFLHGPNRDPFVFQAGGKFHMLVTAAIPAQDDSGAQGALEHLASSDLSSWSVSSSPFLVPGYTAQPECSTLFKWGSWYYLTFGIDGATHYRMARAPTGPWLTPKVDILDSPEAMVMKSATFKNNRRIIVGFLQRNNRFGGNLIFRELVQRNDGSLGTKIPPEMTFRGSPIRTPHTLHLDSANPLARIEDQGSRVRVKATFRSSDSSTPFGIGIGGENGLGAEQLVIDTGAKRVLWLTSAGESKRSQIDGVDGLNAPLTVDITVNDTLVDVTINGQRTLIHRLSAIENHSFVFFTKGSDVDVSNIELFAAK
jgi:beta-fructofuranosidase